MRARAAHAPAPAPAQAVLLAGAGHGWHCEMSCAVRLSTAASWRGPSRSASAALRLHHAVLGASPASERPARSGHASAAASHAAYHLMIIK